VSRISDRHAKPDLVHARQNAVLDLLAVRLPVLSILPPALLLVTHLTVDQQHREVQHVKVGDRDGSTLHAVSGNETRARVQDAVGELVTCEQGRQAVSPAHEPVAKVVDVAGSAPPAAGEQLGPGRGLHVLQVCDLGVVGVRAEAVLLVVAAAEDPVTSSLHAEDGKGIEWAQDDWVYGEVASLKTVGEGQPGEVAKGQHEAESVGSNVDCGQDGGLHVECIEDIDGLADGDHQH